MASTALGNFLVITAAALLLAACATGSSIVTGEKRPPIDPGLVKLYSEPPENFQVIGIVKAGSSAGWTEQESMDYAIEELKQQAARLGANAVIIESTGETTYIDERGYATGSPFLVKYTEQTVSGKAVYLSQ
jgi:uncharacterized protein YbjQ (UPF0145 family)